MSAFSTILSRYFPKIDITTSAFIYPDKDFTLMNKDFVAYGFVNSIHYNTVNELESKFRILNSAIVSNQFIEKNKKKDYEYIFSCAQRTYYGFCRLARKYKEKHALQFNMNTDLCLTPLSNLKSSVKISLYDDDTRTVYQFRLSDLLNIIQTALSNSPEFFAEPLPIKNPYTNMKFTYAQLYTIYFKIRASVMIPPILFQQYFACNFDLTLFSKNNECYIRDIAIKQFGKDATDQQKFKFIMKMLRDYNNCMKGIVIHREFKRKYILYAFEKYLYDYLIVNFTLNPTLRYFTRVKLRKQLIRFSKLNPTFGRKIYYNIKRNASNTKNIAYQFRFDSASSFPMDSTTGTSNSSNPLNFRSSLRRVSTSIQNDIHNIVDNIDASNIVQRNIGIYFVTRVNNNSPISSHTPSYMRNNFFNEAVNFDPLRNTNTENLDNSSDSEYSEADEIDMGTEQTIPTYNITLPNTQNVVIFNQDSVAYISNNDSSLNDATDASYSPVVQQGIQRGIQQGIQSLTTTNTALPLPPPPPPNNSIPSSPLIQLPPLPQEILLRPEQYLQSVNDTAVNDTAVNDTAVNDTAANDTAANDTDPYLDDEGIIDNIAHR